MIELQLVKENAPYVTPDELSTKSHLILYKGNILVSTYEGNYCWILLHGSGKIKDYPTIFNSIPDALKHVSGQIKVYQL